VVQPSGNPEARQQGRDQRKAAWISGGQPLRPDPRILITDYFLIRKKQLVVEDLYSETGQYWYRNGFNPNAIWALVLGILPNVPGFLTTIKLIPVDSVPEIISGLYHYAWFVGFAVSGCVYYGLQKHLKDSSQITDRALIGQ